MLHESQEQEVFRQPMNASRLLEEHTRAGGLTVEEDEGGRLDGIDRISQVSADRRVVQCRERRERRFEIAPQVLSRRDGVAGRAAHALEDTQPRSFEALSGRERLVPTSEEEQ